MHLLLIIIIFFYLVILVCGVNCVVGLHCDTLVNICIVAYLKVGSRWSWFVYNKGYDTVRGGGGGVNRWYYFNIVHIL